MNYQVKGDITLYAKFTIETYTITYKLDGGVNGETGPQLVEAGVDVLVAGSYVFKSEDPIATISSLKAL